MGQNQALTPTQTSVDPVTQYGYPATCKVGVQKDQLGLGEIHYIISATAPTSATVSASQYANAPSGSTLIDLATPKLWYNIAGTWKGTALS